MSTTERRACRRRSGGARVTLFALGLLAGCGARGNSVTGPSDASTADRPVSPTVDVVVDVPVDAPRPGCSSAMDCDDGVACTEDLCDQGVCRRTPVPARCGPGQMCDALRGCAAGRACATNADCADTDPCTALERCDPATRVCQYEALDGDGDGHAPRVCGGDDCDDGDRAVSPEAAERCNGRDDNCNMTADEAPAGAECGAGSVCVAGACACATGFTRCGSACVDLRADPNCGACGVTCRGGASCVGGSCQCPAGRSLCGGVCVDVIASDEHCGGCGNACPASARCAGGACQPVVVDAGTRVDAGGSTGGQCGRAVVDAVCACRNDRSCENGVLSGSPMACQRCLAQAQSGCCPAEGRALQDCAAAAMCPDTACISSRCASQINALTTCFSRAQTENATCRSMLATCFGTFPIQCG